MDTKYSSMLLGVAYELPEGEEKKAVMDWAMVVIRKEMYAAMVK